MKKALFWFCLALLLTLSGCAYYNTLHNAIYYFNKAYKEPLDSNGRIKSTASQNYDKAMEKCGIILTDYKDSQYVDEALFILARCLYHKGNYVTAEEKLREFLRFYPDSKDVGEAQLYLGQCLAKQNRKGEASSTLLGLLADENQADTHSRALMLLGDWNADAKQYSTAELYYRRLVDEHRDADEFEDAFFKLGLTYQQEERFAAADSVFWEMLDVGVNKSLTMDVRYYLALDRLQEKEPEQALDMADKLYDEEFRADKLSRAQLLRARCLSAIGRYDEAELQYNNIIEDKKRTPIAAEASFYLGEMYLHGQHFYMKAIAAYNAVKTQYSTSEYAAKAVAKSAMASQVVQFKRTNTRISTEQLVSQSFKLAEYYLEELSLPDSSFVVYDQIIGQRDHLQAKLDSLLAARNNPAPADSAAVADTVATVVQDSTVTPDAEPGKPTKNEKSDLPPAQAAAGDSLGPNASHIQRLRSDVEKYNTVFIPFSHFIRVWAYKTVLHDSTNALKWADRLHSDYPGTAYDVAAHDLLAGRPVDFKTPAIRQWEKDFATAVDTVENNRDDGMRLLTAISQGPTPPLEQKRNFALGWYNYPLASDSLAARPYYEWLFQNAPESQYVQKLRATGVFDGKKFGHLEMLADLEPKPAKEGESAPDTTGGNTQTDIQYLLPSDFRPPILRK